MSQPYSSVCVADCQDDSARWDDLGSEFVPPGGFVVQSSPGSNTGVTVTSCGIFIDWVAFTIPADVVADVCPDYCIEDMVSILMLPVFASEVTAGGFLGYKSCLVLDGQKGARVGFGGQAGTVYVSLSSEALAYFVARGLDWQGWLIYLHSLGVKFGRIDAALDDHGGLITLPRLLECIKEHGDIRHSTEIRPVGGAFVDRGDDWTIYLGSRSSERYCRIYNKAAEQHLDPNECGPWVRLEVEIKRAAADSFVQALIESKFSPAFIVGYVRTVVDFRHPTTDTNSTRMALCEWWAKFLCGCAMVKVKVERVVRTIAQVRDWFERSLTGVLGMLACQYGHRYLRRLASKGMGSMSPRNMAMLKVAAGMGLFPA